MNKGLDYRQAGVDIAAANKSVEMIKKWVERTRRPEVLSGLGSFGGFFALDAQRYQEPVLVSGTDGVGTKLKIAQMMQVHNTVGIDLVAMCVNDILVHGAEPLFFLDYIALGKLRPDLVESLVEGVSAGCMLAGCALIGGETAEMPGFYGEDEYDLAGFAVGAVERSKIIDGSAVKDGDVIIGLASSGLHANGFSLVRKVLLEQERLDLAAVMEGFREPLGQILLTPTRIYVSPVTALLKEIEVRGMAHITGGGLGENLQRSLPSGLGAMIRRREIQVPVVFDLLRARGRIEEEEMFHTFNMGIGFVIIVSPPDREKALHCLREQGEKPVIIGNVAAQAEGVVIR